LTQINFCLYGRRLLLTSKDKLYEFLPANERTRTKFHKDPLLFNGQTSLQDIKLVDIVYRHDYIYVVSQADLALLPNRSAPAAFTLQDLYNTLSPNLQRLIGKVSWPEDEQLYALAQAVKDGKAVGVSDGSVRQTDEQATHAWIIQANRDIEIKGHGPVDGTNEARTSHRAELQGQTAIFLMLSLLVQYFHIIGGKVKSYCDNQAVVKKLQKGWALWRFRHTKGADGDLQAVLRSTILHLERNHSFLFSIDWVRSHQDKDNDVDLSSFPQEVALNIRMDRDAAAAYDFPLEWTTQG